MNTAETMPDRLSWLREAITRRLELARNATQIPWEAEGDDPTDDEVVIDVEGDPWRTIICRGPQSHENMLHVAANDPRAIIADCEKDLGILEWFEETERKSREAFGDESLISTLTGAHLRQVIFFVAAGYKHHPGWAEAGWGP